MKAEHKFEGNIIKIGKVYNKEEFNDFLEGIHVKPPFIVKPNWISEDYGHFTDPDVLKWLLEFLAPKGDIILTESYSARNLFKCPGIKANSKILVEQDLNQIRASEKKFLIQYGFQSILQELDIEYINVAEEVLAQRVVDPDFVQKQVTSLYEPITRSELYGFVPEKLYKLRQGTFIDLAKFKVFFSMCVKNMFGMIPEHVGYGLRWGYHGKKDKDLATNIVDINRI